MYNVCGIYIASCIASLSINETASKIYIFPVCTLVIFTYFMIFIFYTFIYLFVCLIKVIKISFREVYSSQLNSLVHEYL